MQSLIHRISSFVVGLSLFLTCMFTYDPSPAFHEAATYLSNASSLSKAPTAIKLELYGLFKTLTVSPAPNISRPFIFDITGRAKWDAWSAAGKARQNHKETEQRYLEIARDLGWTEGIFHSAPTRSGGDGSSGSFEGSLDHESESGSSSSRGGSGGMGTYVSAMAPPPLDEQDSKSLHGLAVTNNVSGLYSYLDAHPDVDINQLDEHGYTALHLACDRGNTAVVEHLLRRGADYSLKDPDDFTPLELANIAGHDNIVSLIVKTH